MTSRPLRNAFTLVELLIVIALIAILSVAVLATINPIEQSNKAKDSTVQNDAAEVMNAYERYYASQSSYPWVDVYTGAGKLTVDSQAYLNSFTVGGGLCGSASAPGAATDACSLDYTTNQGLLIKTTELKDSFLGKGYVGNKSVEPATADMLYIIKQSGANGNSIYVCYIPKAKANRSRTSKMVDLAVNASTKLPTKYVTVDSDPATYFSGNDLLAGWTFTSVDTSLFKCVP